MATNKAAPAATPEDKKEKYWGEARNERRRARYAEDAEYRRDVLQRARATQFNMRREQGMDVREGENCRDNLPRLASVEKRDLMLDGEVFKTGVRAVTAEGLAELLNRDPQVLYRWMGKDMLPRPVFESLNDRNRRQAVYTTEEARAIMEVFGAHQETSLYFRTSHTDTISRIHAAVAAVRQKMGVGHGGNQKATRH